MSHNQTNPYNINPHIVEIYDQQENYTDDVHLLLDLINGRGPLNIFEPFCGTGRILIPLARAGHHLTGLDQSGVFLNCCKEKLRNIGKTALLIEGDAVGSSWPEGFDLVVLGGNCFYELANLEEQEGCILAAASALKPGGYLFIDNDHMEGDLSLEWRDTSPRPCFPSGICADGVRLESTIQTIWFDVSARLVRFRRKTKTIFPDGHIIEHTYIQQKHPISTQEVRLALERFGLVVEKLYGSRDCQPYTDSSPRAIFWAQKNR